MFTGTKETSNENYINTGIYAHHRIVSNTGLRTTKNSSTITMLNHTITGSTTSNGYTSSYSITGDNLYTLLQQLLGRVADALNYAKAAYAYADSAYTYAGQAYTYAGQAYAVGNHSHPYASNTHTHTLTLDTYYAYTYSTNDHRHQFSYEKPSRITGGPN